MDNKQTAEELRKKASELLALADKISPPIQKTGKTANAKGNAIPRPSRKPDWLDKQNESLQQLRKGKQLSGG